ncbi:hypothetical protein HHI36_008599 [Cryptolaemus montrouzieri]|uniref:DUF7041 domain-containing protein n=1 Tax=Cryptolaemus montrouzieri TaxID=559131 RepID=A0ABD2MT33_9CUCU
MPNSAEDSTDRENALVSVTKCAIGEPCFGAYSSVHFGRSGIMVLDAGRNFRTSWSDNGQFSYITGVLEPRYALDVSDIIVNKPAKDAYDTLKKESIKRLSSSQDQKTRRLLELEEMGGRKPRIKT